MFFKKFDSTRLIKFLMVGAIGVGINYIIYFSLKDMIIFTIFNFYIDVMWFVGIIISALSNYILNELWTFNRDVIA